MTKTKQAPTKFKQYFRSFGGFLFFLIVISATFYPILSAGLFSKQVNSSLDPRKVNAAHQDSAQASASNLGVFRNGVVSIAFDDGWLSAYENGVPILDENGFKGTFYILSNRFDDYQYMSIGQARSLINSGHIIGSHTVSHPDLTELSVDDLEYELIGSQKQLQEKLGEINDFASPYGKYSEDSMRIVKASYRSHRTVENGINTFENFDKYKLKSPNIVVTSKASHIKEWIDEARKHNGWLILTYHEVDDSGRPYSITKEEFEAQMKVVKESGLPVATIDQVLNEIEQTYGTNN